MTDIPAQVDTGGDVTVIRQSVVERLGIRPIRWRIVGRLGASLTSAPAFVVRVAIDTRPDVHEVEVIQADEPWVLLGRDVLNHYRILLEGPIGRLIILE